MTGNEFKQNDHVSSSDQDMDRDETPMPIGVGGMDDDGFEGGDMIGTTGEEQKRGVNSGAILLVAVVLIAIAGLFSMRTLTRASAATEAPSEIEQSIESFLSMLNSSQSQQDGKGGQFALGSEEVAVLDVLNESYASRQVALSDVQRNPFILFENGPEVADTPTRPTGPDPMIQKRKDREALFAQAAGRFELRSVLMGNPALATIGNQIVQVGATVTAEPEDVRFQVIGIESDAVTIVAEDEELGVRHEAVLKIDRERRRTGGRR